MKRPVTYMIVMAGIWLGETGKVFSRDVHSLQDEKEVAVAVSDVQATMLPHDLSPVGMFISADRIVKIVMLGLLFASALTWTIWIAKSIELVSVRRRTRKAVEIILYAKSLENAVATMQKEKGSGAQMVRAAAEEVRISIAAVDDAGNNGLKERIASLLMRIELQAGRHISRGMGILATIGSVSPFVGLFGTVWGIMNSFIGISQTQTTSLAVVAPGIAEALLATAIGLVAAIPAVIIYNVFARSISGYKQILADASAGIERLASRDLDFYKTDKKSDKAIRSKITE